MKNNRTHSLVSFLSYTVGIVIGLFLIIIATWADMESAFYGFSRYAEAGLDGFSCPVLMTSDETGTISLSVSNKTDRVLTPSIKTDISTPILPLEIDEKIELAPGESKKLTWSVGPDNIDLGHFIFAKAMVYSVYPIANQEATCGIYILDLPGSGRVILPILVVLSILGMGWGLYEINKAGELNDWPERNFRALAFMAAMVVLGFGVSFWGGWVPAVLLVAAVVLLIITLLVSLLMSERRKHW